MKTKVIFIKEEKEGTEIGHAVTVLPFSGFGMFEL